MKRYEPTAETRNVVSRLRGKWHGDYAMCHCPAHDDRNPSLSLRQGEKGILVHCFAGCDRDDVLRAIRSQNISFGNEAGKKSISNKSTSNIAKSIWDDAMSVKGTIAVNYLRRRGLSSELNDLKFHPKCPFGSKSNAVYKPALIVAVKEGAILTSIQRIMLEDDGSDYVKKQSIGKPGQGAWQQMPAGKVLAIAEGMEDAAAFTKLYGVNCWATLSGSRMHKIAIPLFVDKLIIAIDNDEAGEKAAARCVASYHDQVEKIMIEKPNGVKDFADELLGKY